MLTSWITALQIVARTGAVYLLVVGVRLTGKLEVGQMTPFDLTLLLLLSNSVQNAMTGPDTSLAGGVVAATVLLTLNYTVAELSGINRKFRRVVQGSPSLLNHDGELLTDHLKKEHLTVDEVMRALREHGIGALRRSRRSPRSGRFIKFFEEGRASGGRQGTASEQILEEKLIAATAKVPGWVKCSRASSDALKG